MEILGHSVKGKPGDKSGEPLTGLEEDQRYGLKKTYATKIKGIWLQIFCKYFLVWYVIMTELYLIVSTVQSKTMTTTER